jgi:hypothetical protein
MGIDFVRFSTLDFSIESSTKILYVNGPETVSRVTLNCIKRGNVLRSSLTRMEFGHDRYDRRWLSVHLLSRDKTIFHFNDEEIRSFEIPDCL